MIDNDWWWWRKNNYGNDDNYDGYDYNKANLQ